MELKKNKSLVLTIVLLILFVSFCIVSYNINYKYTDCMANDTFKDNFWFNDTCYEFDLHTRYKCETYNKELHENFCHEVYGGFWD